MRPPILSLLIVLALAPAAAAQREEFPAATPESQGLSSENLSALLAEVQGYLDAGAIVGAELAVIKNRKLVLHEVVGWKDREGQVPMAPNTIMNIRSMTKTLTGAAAQILIDEGALDLDDRVADYIPGFDNERSEEITVGHLMTHRSGLPLSIMLTAEDLTRYESLFDLAEATGERGPEFPVDSKFWYSDAGSEVLGAVVEEASGQDLGEFVRERLLDPIGMNDTLTATERDDPRWSELAHLYAAPAGQWVKFWTPDQPFYRFALGSQSLYSTTLDYARFVCMWMDGGKVGDQQVLSEEAVLRTLTPTSRMTSLGSDAPFPTLFRGLEPWYGQMSVLYIPLPTEDGAPPTAFGHSGSDGTITWAFPAQDLVVSYFTQSRGGSTAIRLEKLVDELLANPDAPPEEVPEKWQPLVGRYAAMFEPFNGRDFEVLVWDGRLTLDIPSQMFVGLEGPDAEGKWRAPMLGPKVLEFIRDDGGKVTALAFDGAELPRR